MNRRFACTRIWQPEAYKTLGFTASRYRLPGRDTKLHRDIYKHDHESMMTMNITSYW